MESKSDRYRRGRYGPHGGSSRPAHQAAALPRAGDDYRDRRADARGALPLARLARACADGGRCRRRLRSGALCGARELRSEEHTSELQSLMRISYAVFCLKKKKTRSHMTCDKVSSMTLQ